MEPRDADESDLPALTALWHAAWHDAHARIVPGEIAVLRTPESFEERLRAFMPHVRVVGAPVGFHVVRSFELHQFYVAAAARGTGVAARLLADAEGMLSERGVHTAWLTCAVGNERARRFYEKHGWRLARTGAENVPTPAGAFRLSIWRFEKQLSPTG